MAAYRLGARAGPALAHRSAARPAPSVGRWGTARRGVPTRDLLLLAPRGDALRLQRLLLLELYGHPRQLALRWCVGVCIVRGRGAGRR
jgi:hypothetical protein